jgi:hypothetical protein
MAMFDVFKKKKEGDGVDVEFSDDLGGPELPDEPKPALPDPPDAPAKEPSGELPPIPPLEPPKDEPRSGPSLPPLPKLPPLPGYNEPKKEEPMVPKPVEDAPVIKPPAVPVSPEDDKMIPLYEPPKDVPQIKPPTKPVMAVKPHVFVKVDQYKEVLGSIDRIKDMLTEMKQTISDIKRFEAQESAKLQVCDSIANQITSVVEFFDKTFTRPEM